ncbi:uncharacterized protein LOC117170051 [Belonocnema kinseyi]|uniref:uncharacterized protein LOC117170051 n=1 Tax=Belonocnema kinseyi TaxID=2817044 RepID=UPI00143DCA89|nr:uncharacterized protein LOC117170051 [Belonocnema kinseyi]XP_033212468.1 uncharacterized protein LOC117170051 [Belonocnema kinseyi]XP_033212470.1 uncharacterized protein LOC117170051 [Belonocnema kinseyi]XP_033212475.1 uncharacterized protein LOC117170051 [Belonocnema kinseyi]XP_033212481.1 uncharacterized protein LOC117170051 [Belonocnema kinseyi]XP_033212489.1 uncharacterized protein LOC117170051 [Belonocnema kinseyi]XP_033212497.1 uncharacterized protein LOC117170051 [Belonocnema kinsey
MDTEKKVKMDTEEKEKMNTEENERMDTGTQTDINFDSEPWKFKCNIRHLLSILGIIHIGQILMAIVGLLFLVENMKHDDKSMLKKLLRIWNIIIIVARVFRMIPHLFIDNEKPLWMKHRMLYFEFVYTLVDAIFHLFPFIFMMIHNPQYEPYLIYLKIFLSCSFTIFVLHILWNIYRLRKLRLKHGQYKLRIKQQDNMYMTYGRLYYVTF